MHLRSCAPATLSAPIRYAELAARLGVEVGDRAPLADAAHAVLALRRGKGMVLDPADHDTWSAGSFFTNPVLDADGRRGCPPSAPRCPQPDGDVKTSAAWLIEHAGFAAATAPAPVGAVRQAHARPDQPRRRAHGGPARARP